MKGSRRSGTPARLSTVWLAVFCVIHAILLPCVTGQPRMANERLVVGPGINPFENNVLSPQNQIVDDVKTDEEILEEKQKENKNRAFGAGYLAIAPKVMCAGGREKLFITFVNFTQPVDVMFAVMENKEETIATTTIETFSTPCGCLELDLPHIDEPRKTVSLIMYAKRHLMQCEEFEIINSIKIFLDACNSETFIETDKPIYKPGQKVHFRVLTLLPDLRPDLSDVAKIWIESPGGIHMAQWLAIKTKDGLIDLSLPMSTDPPMGDWKIKVRHHDREFVQTFEVGEYVLPKYEVMLQGPDYVMIDTNNLDITVCGRYTHGQPVRGSITLEVSVSTNQEKLVKDFARETDSKGCYLFDVDIASLNLMQADYGTYNAKLVLKAIFEETSTHQIVEKTSENTVISTSPFKLEFSVPSTFKPGLSYSGMLIFTDPSGKPLPATESVVKATVENEDIFLETVMSNGKGIAYFTIANIPIHAKFVSLLAISEGYRIPAVYNKNLRTIGIDNPAAYANSQPQFSPSKSYLQIDPITETAEVNTFQTLTIHMTSDKPEYNGVYLHTVMMARGNILLSVESIIPPEEIDGFRRPGSHGVYPIETDAMGMKEFPSRQNMKVTDIPVNILDKGKAKTTRRKISILYEMSPAVTVMVYYIREDGEVVADTVSIPVEEVFQNKVEVKFTEDKKQPGDATTLRVRAKPSSLCAYGVVDKSVHLLGGDNRITKEKIFKALENLQLSAEGDYAEPHRCHGGSSNIMRGFFQPPQQNLNDASQAFKDLGVVYFTNLKVDTAPCPEYTPYYAMRGPEAAPVMMMAEAPMMMMMEDAVISDFAEDSVDAPPQIRSYFPETWLYSLVRVGSDGHSDIPVEVPHTITEWIGHGFCTSTRFGAGVSELTMLTVFQPFFVDMSLPYSVIRNEIIPVTVVVFNYVTKCLVVKFTLQPSSSFEIDAQNRKEFVCVCGGESVPASFYVKAVELGTIPVEVHAIAVEDTDDWCKGKERDESRTGISDGIQKSLLVKPEGVETEQVFSTFFCPSDYPKGLYEEVIALRDLPENYVAGSERGIVTLTGDMLGPTISNLDQLLRMPTGCGEQNMIGFVPNIFVMHYLKGINQLTPAIKTKATEHMKVGYQRELTYRHGDGSYSAFGLRDQSGSTWLTAFVLRSFGQATKYIYVDPQDLEMSKSWLLKRQGKEDGCIESVGKVIHKDMMGKVDDVVTLTAYVIISLIEAGDEPDAKHIKSALACLDQKVKIELADMYTLAIVGYAYILAGIPHRDDILKRLNELAVESDDGLKHWEGRPEPVTDDHPPYLHHQASSQHIEITSYVLLTYIRAYDKSEALIEGNPVARWIVGQRNANGGFSSTQDTVMALQALAEYGMMAYVDGDLDLKLAVKFSCEAKANWLYVQDHNRLILQTLAVPQVPVEIKMNATGDGCAMTQVIVTYNVIPEEPVKPPFAIDFNYKEIKDYTPDPCTSFTLTVCAQFTGEDEFSNMAVIQVRMVSGFEPDANNMRMLKATKALGSPKRIEQEGKDVFFYFDQLGHENTCFEFTMTRDKFVKEPRDGVITVFDYYEKALSVSELYNFKCTGMA